MIWPLQPVNVNASFGEHEEPEVHVSRVVVVCGQCVVDQEPSVWEPENGKYGHNYYQHLDNLPRENSNGCKVNPDPGWKCKVKFILKLMDVSILAGNS